MLDNLNLFMIINIVLLINGGFFFDYLNKSKFIVFIDSLFVNVS